MRSETVDAAGLTHVGWVRKQNEDAFVLADKVWVVADGLGGHAGGEVASDIAARTAAAVLLAGRGAARGPEHLLIKAFEDAHAAVQAAAAQETGLDDMGTTLVAGYRDDDGGVHLGSVGDSRAYRLTGTGLEQLTTDDNEAEELVAAGLITRAQARVHPGQFSLTKALLAYELEPPVPQVVSIYGPGRLLLCSDGLMAELDDEQIGRLLAAGAPADSAAALVQATLEAGASDNVTIVVVDL